MQTNKSSTRRSLLVSATALILSIAMLVGTTFAWFTDSASTGVNKIQAGNLDIALEMKDNSGNWVNAEGKTLQFKVDGSIPAEGTQILWEPGCTYELPELRIINNGNLKLKYKIVISGIGGDVGLNKAIEWTMTVKASDGNSITRELTADHALEANAYNTLFISGHMKEDAGNEYQGKSIDNIAITVAATQLGGNLDSVSGENDSFNNEYDKEATYPPLATYLNETTTTAKPANGDMVITTPVAKSTVPAAARIESARSTESSATTITNHEMVADSSIERVLKTTNATADSVTYDISYVYTETSNSTTTSYDVSEFSMVVTNVIQLSTGLKEVKVTHSHGNDVTEMEAASDETAAADGKFFYNPGTGELTVWSSKYSTFAITYKSDFAAATGGQGYTTLEEAFTAAKDGALITVLKDITLTGDWTPIETFKGTLDGNGHTISGLNVSGDDYVGLIGVLDGGTVKNLKLANVTATGTEDVGAVVGRIINNGKVENVHVLSGTLSCTSKRVGGLVGSIKAYGSIINCSNAASVSATGSARNAGGIVGSAYYTESGKEMYITNCTNTGAVTSGSTAAGGIVSLSAANVSDCTNSAAIRGAGTSIGGIVGEQKTYGSVTNNTNSGTVTNLSSAYGNGGIIGWLRYHGSSEEPSYAVSDIIKVTGNTNSGNVSGGNDAGGIIGTVYNSAVVTGNTNTASSLSGTTFAAGIVGNYQITETPADPAPASNKLTFGDNTTSTPLDRIQASNKALEIYTNGNEVIYAYSGPIIPVNPSNIQGFLDGKYGSIDGKTLVLSAGNYGKLELGRATKYAGSNTDYYIGGISEENKKTYDQFVAIKNSSDWSASAYYVRNMRNVNLKAADGAAVSVAGLVASSGHVYGEVYDYVLDKAYTSGSAYYLSQKLEYITIEGITFTAKTEFATSSADTVIDGVTFKNCTFNIGSTASSNQALRYYNESNNGNVKNLTVDSCKFNTCYQGVYTQKINGVTVKNCTFDTTGHNAIAVQSDSEAVNHKAVVITGNTFKNIGNRIIRFGKVDTDTQITIQKNTATDSGDTSGQVIKAESLAEGVTYNISGNSWGEGKTVANPEFADHTA